MWLHQQCADARSVLGPDHPLARVTTQLSVAVERVLAVSVPLALGIVALTQNMSIGPSLAAAAVVVLAALLARIGVLLEARNRHALELIAQGRGELPIEAVVRGRRRLLDPGQRECLARALDATCAEAWRPPSECHPAPPLYSVRVVRAVSCELGELATLVRRGGDLRGLAATELMVTDGRSPLYGDSEAVLRQELARIRFLFASRDADGVANGDRSPFPAARGSRSLEQGRPRAEVTVVRSLRELLRRQPPQETQCPRCGVPAPPGDIECTACGWDLRDAYHDPLAEQPGAVTGDRGT